MRGKYAKWTRGDEESLLNKHGGEEGARAFIRGELKLVPRDPATDLLCPLGEPIELPAVPKFIAKDAFTKANGIAYMGDNFQKFILPLVEENVPAATLTVSELIRDARDLRIAAELKVDERGEVALAHFFQVLQDRSVGIRTDGWANAAFIGAGSEGWVANANLRSVGWNVNAYRLGSHYRWDAGYRFLSL